MCLPSKSLEPFYSYAESVEGLPCPLYGSRHGMKEWKGGGTDIEETQTFKVVIM